MKKIIYTVLLAIGVTSCSLDTFPGGDTFTEEQKEELLEKNPEKLEADINGLAANLIKLNTLGAYNTKHFDYGYPAICLMFDASSADLTSGDSGYNHFASPLLFLDRSQTSLNTEMIWRVAYGNIKGANDALETITKLLGNTGQSNQNVINTFNYYKAQAFAYRAFSYMLLVQTYQFTYIGHENEPAVPIKLTKDDERNNSKRATVAEVYELILDDLNQAIEILESSQISRGEDKSKVNAEVVYGLRARVNLIMNKWDEAAKDAKLAQRGFTPYKLTDLEKPSFNSAKAESWMWANMITPNTDAGASNIINWPSHLCSMTGGAYTTMVGMYKGINAPLWKAIPETDIRKHWWLDEEVKSPLTDDMLIRDTPIADAYGWKPLVNVKFHAYQDIPGNSVKASDWPIMRVEEMILIEAEALAMNGNINEAKTVLTDFVKAYRDPEYDCKANSTEELRDEVWFQRRVELWGEGHSLFDTLRLKKPIHRVVYNEEGNPESSFDASAQFNISAEDQIMIYLLPEKEIEGNPNLEASDNNPLGTTPKPVSLKK